MSFNFNSTNVDVLFGSGNVLDNLTAFTYALWIKVNSANMGSNLFDKGTGGGGSRRRLRLNIGTNQVHVLIDLSTTDAQAGASNGYTTGAWTFLVATWTSADIGTAAPKLYSGSLTSAVSLLTNDQADISGTGSTGDNSGDTATFGGQNNKDFDVAWFGVWNRVLTLAELRAQQFRPHLTNGCVLFSIFGANGLTDAPNWCGSNVPNGTVGSGISLSNPVPLGSPIAFRRFWAVPIELAAAQIIAVNQVTETDLAQAIGRLKTRSVVQVTETDLAQAIASVKLKAIGQVTESDIGQAITWAPKHRLVNQVIEGDLAQGISWAPKHRLVNLVTETDLAQAIASAKLKQITQVLEADLAQAIDRLKTQSAAQVTETDLAQPITVQGEKIIAVNQVTETDLAQAIASAKLKGIAAVLETDLAQAIGRLKTLAIAQTLETDLAQAITVVGAIVVNQVTETDLAQAIGRLKTLALGQVTESDLAQLISILKTVGLGLAIETDLAQAILWAPKHRLVAQVTETDLAQVITRIGGFEPLVPRPTSRDAPLDPRQPSRFGLKQPPRPKHRQPPRT